MSDDRCETCQASDGGCAILQTFDGRRCCGFCTHRDDQETEL